MVIMAALIHLGERAVFLLGLILAFGHNAFDGMRLQPGDQGFALWTFINQAGLVQISSDRFFLEFGDGKWFLGQNECPA